MIPQMEEITGRMQPGMITLAGFLGTDSRSLEDILETDNKQVAGMGLTHQVIAGKMMALRDAGMEGLGEPISVPPNFEVIADSVRGNLPCPYGDPGIFPKTSITVRNLRLHREITYTDLSIHLIYAHGFYQGSGSPYRTDPADLAEILEIHNEK